MPVESTREQTASRMDFSHHRRWYLPNLAAFGDLFSIRSWGLSEYEPDELRFAATIAVWGRWFVAALCVGLLMYRPILSVSQLVGYMICLAILVSVNAIGQYRLASDRPVTWRWMLGTGAIDIALISAAMTAGGGFSHYLFYLLFYPALALFAVVFGSFKLNMAWTTLVAAVYVTISLTVGQGLDLEARDDKTLFTRIVVMFVVVATANLATSHERMRRRRARERERELERSRIELSRSIHDRTAQSLYMIGLGIDTAVEEVEASNGKLLARLEAAKGLSKSAMWELRHPIDVGLIFEGRELGQILKGHVESFTTITSVSAKMEQIGEEPELSPVVRGMLFSIAHNALTNAFRHASPNTVKIDLEFSDDRLRMTVSDDGIGLPDDYETLGHGFRNMRADAERAGGRLEVDVGPSGKGTSVTCFIEYPNPSKGV